MSAVGAATFSGAVTVSGDLTVNGSLTLGDNVALDTLTVNAIVTNNNLTLFRENNDANPFELILQHRTDSPAIGDKQGQVSFWGSNNVTANDDYDDYVRSSIHAAATVITNGNERSEIVISTAQGSQATAERIRFSNTIQSHVNILPYKTGSTTTSVDLGATAQRFNNVYATGYYGLLRDNIRDNNATARDVLELGTEHPLNSGTPNSNNYTKFYGKLIGVVDGRINFSDTSDTILSGDTGNGNANYYLSMVANNNTVANPDYEQSYTHGTLYFNPFTDTLNATKFSGNLTGNIVGTDGTTVVLTLASATATLLGTVSSLSNHDTDDLSEGSTNKYFTNARARDALSGGTGITYTSSTGEIKINASEIQADSADNIKITDTTNNGTFFVMFSDGTGAAESVFTNSADFTYNPSTTTLTVPFVNGEASSATYADLAERYQADTEYEPGTVLVFGGENEVTICTSKGDRKVAGVVSTNPAYLMNSGLEGNTVVDLALQGRVPCKVIGRVEKGDMLVTSAVPGYAIVDNDPKLGTVIGKAVGTKDDDGKGIVEVVVGRL